MSAISHTRILALCEAMRRTLAINTALRTSIQITLTELRAGKLTPNAALGHLDALTFQNLTEQELEDRLLLEREEMTYLPVTSRYSSEARRKRAQRARQRIGTTEPEPEPPSEPRPFGAKFPEERRTGPFAPGPGPRYDKEFFAKMKEHYEETKANLEPEEPEEKWKPSTRNYKDSGLA